MLRRSIAFVALIFLAASTPLAARQRAVRVSAPLAVPGVDAIAQRALDEHIPGLIIGVRKGDAFFVKAYGDYDAAAHVAMREEQPMQIGSITKQFTAAAIMRLAEAGTLQTSDSIRKWIPELGARFDRITIEHLLTHTSGLGDYFRSISIAEFYTPHTQEQMIALIDRSAFYFGPGESWRYSNSGYYLLGVVVERAANQPFAQYVRDAFERPLALTQTSYCGEYVPPPSGYLTTQPGNAGAAPTPPLDMTLLYSAGALCSTARDLLRWNGALAHGQAVAQQSYARMSSDVRLSDGTLLPYGYALALDPLDGHRRVWHNGLVPGFQSHLAWFPDEDLTVVVLLNLTTETDNASAIADEVARAMFR